MTRMMSPALIAAVAALAVLGITAGDASPHHASKNCDQLTFRIAINGSAFQVGQPILLTATVTNNGIDSISVDQQGMFRYISYERESSEEVLVTGQVIGDSPLEEKAPTKATLRPHQSVARTLNIAAIASRALIEPGKYRMYLDYCPFVDSTTKERRMSAGCVKSNEVAFVLQDD